MILTRIYKKKFQCASQLLKILLVDLVDLDIATKMMMNKIIAE